jgi:hypothetical protein
MVRALAAPWAHVYVHIDAKSDIGAFLHELSDTPDVTLIRDRVSVNWGGWSQVEASLRLIGAAREHDPPFGRFVLLSGACYPLRSNTALRDFLFADNREHISVVRMPNAEMEKPLTRLTRWHFEGGDRTAGSKAALTRLLNRAALLGPPRDVQKALDGFAPYAGSSWWALTRQAVEITMRTSSARPQLAAFYRHTAFADESFFHTVLGNSLPSSRFGASLNFADWSPGARRPHMISERHLAQLLAPGAQSAVGTPYFFARKFDAGNAYLLDRIDAARRDDTARVVNRTAIAAA